MSCHVLRHSRNEFIPFVTAVSLYDYYVILNLHCTLDILFLLFFAEPVLIKSSVFFSIPFCCIIALSWTFSDKLSLAFYYAYKEVSSCKKKSMQNIYTWSTHTIKLQDPKERAKSMKEKQQQKFQRSCWSRVLFAKEMLSWFLMWDSDPVWDEVWEEGTLILFRPWMSESNNSIKQLLTQTRPSHLWFSSSSWRSRQECLFLFSHEKHIWQVSRFPVLLSLLTLISLLVWQTCGRSSDITVLLVLHLSSSSVALLQFLQTFLLSKYNHKLTRSDNHVVATKGLFTTFIIDRHHYWSGLSSQWYKEFTTSFSVAFKRFDVKESGYRSTRKFAGRTSLPGIVQPSFPSIATLTRRSLSHGRYQSCCQLCKRSRQCSDWHSTD